MPTQLAAPAIVDDISRRDLILGAAALTALAGFASACGDDEEPAASSATSAGSTAEPSGLRVVALGQASDADTLVALGITPVAVLANPVFEQGLAPWTITALGGAEVPVLESGDSAPIEAIAELRPDVIVATTYYGLDDTRDQLAALATLVEPVNGPGADRWQDTVVHIGRAVDREADAQRLVAEAEERIRTAALEHPELVGRTFTTGPVQPDGTITTVRSADDVSASLLLALGMELSPAVTALPDGAVPGRAEISPERLDLLDADIMLLTYRSPEAQATLEANPLFQAIPAVARDAYVVVDVPVAMAMAFPSTLSIPYALDQLVPLLSHAVE